MRILPVCHCLLALMVSSTAMTDDLPSVDRAAVHLDVRGQRIALDVPEWSSGSGEAPLQVLPPWPEPARMVSASVLAQKAKQFDDGLMAAVELAAQEGVGTFPGKAAMLHSMAGAAAHGGLNLGTSTLLAALLVGGDKLTEYPQEQVQSAQWRARQFFENPVESRPMGFYTWSAKLGALYLQDRLLQQPVNPVANLAPLATALAHDPGAAASYSAYLQLESQLTNPLAYPDLRPAIAAAQTGEPVTVLPETRILPASVSYEGDLVKRLYREKSPPEGYSLIDDLMARMAAGTLDVHPRADSGWYDWQTWSLETLVAPERAPEADRLQLGEGYRASLKALFRGLFALGRETQAKQLEVPVIAISAPPRKDTITLTPQLQVEPLASYYLRRAQGYHFVHSVLVSAFGEQGLASLHRLGPDGAVAPSLADELADMEKLFLGASAAANSELGLPAADSESLAYFMRWRAHLAQDPDLTRDVRMMVPLFYDRGRQKTKVLVFLGWSTHPLTVSYAQPPTITAQPKGVSVQFGADRETVLTPVVAEIYVHKLMNRKEFRALCDRYTQPEALIEALQNSMPNPS